MAGSQVTVATEQFKDWKWRLNNLYYVVDKDGERVLFKMKAAQEKLFDNMHYLNTVLKARQIGFTTFIQIFMLDACLFNRDIAAATTAHTLDAAENIFASKIKYPYNNLPEGLRDAVQAVKKTTLSIELSNNSSIKVGTSHRSGTFQYLHISEYGKICAKFPDKAREIRTGSLNTVQAGNVVFIESTAEGQEGDFYRLCEDGQSKERRGIPLSKLDFKFHFFPWWDEEEYRLDPTHVEIPAEVKTYFKNLKENEGIECDAAQIAFYAKKLESQQEDMKREFPSTPKEAFEASIEGAYYGKQMAKAELQGRLGDYPAMEGYPVHTAWDIGYGDNTAIWFFQCVEGGIRVVGFYENHGEYLEHYDDKLQEMCKENKWRHGHAYVPHDIKVHEWAFGKIRIDEMITRGLCPVLVPDISIEDGRNAVRNHLPICTFDAGPTFEGTQHLKMYRKDWDELLATWKKDHRKDSHVHGADAFRYLVAAYQAYKPVAPLPDYELDPAGKPIILGKPPKVLTQLSYNEFHSIQKHYDRHTKV